MKINSGIFSKLNKVYVCSDYTCPMAKKCLAFMQGEIIKNTYGTLTTLCKSEKECPSFIPLDNIYQLNRKYFDTNKKDERFRPTNGLYLAKPIEEIRENIAVVPQEYNWIRSIFNTNRTSVVCDSGHITYKTKAGNYPDSCKVCNAPIISRVYRYMKQNNNSQSHNFMTHHDIDELIKLYPADIESLRYMSAYVCDSVTVESGERNMFSVISRNKNHNDSKKVYLNRIKNAAGRMKSSILNNKTPNQVYDELSTLAVSFIAEWELTSISTSIRKIAKEYKQKFNDDMNSLYSFTEITNNGPVEINYEQWKELKDLGELVKRRKRRNVSYESSGDLSNETLESLTKYNSMEFDIEKIPYYDFETFLKLAISNKKSNDYNNSIIGKNGIEHYQNQIKNSFTSSQMHKLRNSDIYSIKGFFYKMSAPHSKDPIINGCYNFIMDTVKTFITFITSSRFRDDIDFNKLYTDLQLCWKPFELFNYIRDGFIKHNLNLRETYEHRDLKKEQQNNKDKLSILDNINGIEPLIILFMRDSVKGIIKSFNNSNEVNDGQLLKDSIEYDSIVEEDETVVDIKYDDCSDNDCSGILFTTPYGKDIMNMTANNYIKDLTNGKYISTQRKRNANNTSMYSGISIIESNNSLTCLARLTDNNQMVFRTKKIKYDFNSSTLLMILLDEYLYELKPKQVLKSKHRLNTLGNYEFYEVCKKYFKIDKYKDLITIQKYR